MTAPLVVETNASNVEDGPKNIYVPHRQTGRRRSPSEPVSPDDGSHNNNGAQRADPPPAPNIKKNEQMNGTDVGTVVSKAKRAAQSLWLLIHAQNCRIGGEQCPHPGCTEAKKVLLHVKTCPAGQGCDCPSRFNGCYQSRKLLAHYQTCKEIRAKQAGMGRRAKSQHVCLVCSLVARHARNVLEGGKQPTFARKQSSGHAKRHVVASFTLKQSGNEKSVVVPTLSSPNQKQHMPPPPPRRQSTKTDDNTDAAAKPTGENHLMLFSEVAAAAAPPVAEGTAVTAQPEAQGQKSLDSDRSTFLTFAANALSNLKCAPPQLVSQPRTRTRAESYDETAARMMRSSKQQQSPPSNELDPTMEFDLLQRAVELREESDSGIIRRGRSASLGVLATCCVERTCDPIAEEER